MLLMVDNVNSSAGSPIRAAIAGYGLSGRVFHAPFIASSPDFELAAIITADEKRRAQAATDHPSARIYESFEELESSGDQLDLIVLAGPPNTHLDHALRALRLGAAVVVDKPFIANVAAAAVLITAAASAARLLMVFHNRRWDGDFLTVQSLIASGRLGDVFHFESVFEHWAPVATADWKDQLPASVGGGVAFDLGSHLVDQALVLFGPATLLSANLRTLRAGGGNDDHSELLLEHDSGVVSRLLMSRQGHMQGPRFRVLGTKGSFISYGLDPQEPALNSGGLPTDPGFGEVASYNYGTLTEESPSGPLMTSIPTERGNYAEFYSRAALAIRGEGPEPVPSAEALAVVAILQSASQS
jgi:scyllo-inositol 2-dehydrogenase (NADP+)